MVVDYLYLTHLQVFLHHMGAVVLPKISLTFHSITKNKVEPPTPSIISVFKTSKAGNYSTGNEPSDDFWRRELGHLF
jgi:hypothetical protein